MFNDAPERAVLERKGMMLKSENSEISVHINVSIKRDRKWRHARCSQSELVQRLIAALTMNCATRREGMYALNSMPPRELFNSAERKLVLHEDRIVLCGAEVWRDCGQPVVRDALAMLSQRDADGFVRIRGIKLTNDLGRDPSNCSASVGIGHRPLFNK